MELDPLTLCETYGSHKGKSRGEHATYGDTLAVFPHHENILRALHLVGHPDNVRVVIL